MRSSVLVLAAPLLALPATAQAHFTLLAPPPASNSTNGGKGDPPCGPTDMPSNVVTPVMGGSKLMLKVSETVFHPGFYRIALSIKSRDELPIDNVVKDASGKVLPPAGPGTSATADYQTTPVFPVLADNLWAHTTDMKMFSGEITLPNVNCDKCTLQVIEFMAQHGSNGPKAGYFYHHCADLKITADSSKPIFDPTAAGGAGGGSSGGASGTAGGGGAAGGALAGSGGAATAGAANSGGIGGTIAGTAGSPTTGVSGGGATGAGVAGSPAIAGSVGAGTAGGTGTSNQDDGGDSGGCALSNRAAGSKGALALLVGLFVLGRRRNRRA
ncbi:MAG TPA: SCE4755 family polysaccharide monooxygenase-like protein [Polyangiaceae bacterium]|nr:SCE4755 family polysaccharide monooxygenase-like protein [Polyangiaceae bacterium]